MWPTLTQTYVLSRFRVGVEMNISFFIFLSSCSAGLLGSWVYSERPYFNWIKSKKLSGSVSCNNDFLNIKISTSTTWGRPVRTNQQEKSTKTHRAEILSGVNSLGVGIILFPLSSVRAMQIPRPLECRCIADLLSVHCLKIAYAIFNTTQKTFSL